MALHAICHFHVPQAVPLDGQVSYSELAVKCKVKEKELTRLIRHAMNVHLFHEPKPGFVAHTADTALLVKDSTLFDLVMCVVGDLRPASLKVTDALDKW